MREWHTSPFEMAELKFVIRAPIFVARQWVRHRTASWNEISGRYAELPEECYVPDLDRIQQQSAANKQGSAGDYLPSVQNALRKDFVEEQVLAKAGYQVRLTLNMSKELARINLPVSQYTEWVWKVDLHNLLHFLRLRLDAHAQLEIRVYAEVISKWVQKLFPITWEAFGDYRLDAVTFSRLEMIVIQESLQYNCTESQAEARAKELGLAPREVRRLLSVVEFPSK